MIAMWGQVPRWVLYALPIVWIGTVAGGMLWLWHYASSPGKSASPPSHWPSDSQLVRALDRPTLVMFAHPKCPCTRASIAELERAMTRCRERVLAHVVFFQPTAAAADWEQTQLTQAARQVPGVRVHYDVGNEEAARFAARTSGQVMLYDAAGLLLFQGGITAARGHEGDNAGRDAVVSLVTTGSAEVHQTSAFGCPLHDERSSDERLSNER